MQLTRETEYALLGLISLAQNPSERQEVSEIARTQKISESFLKKIFQKLSRKKIIKGCRGKCGGFILARDAKEITMCEVIRSIEGEVLGYACTDKTMKCGKKKSCKLIKIWEKAEKEMSKVFENTTIADLIK